jgi:hypothetical protein
MRVVGLSAGLLELVVGIPLVINTTISLGRSSLFSLGSIDALTVVIIFLRTNLWEKLTGASEDKTTAQLI